MYAIINYKENEKAFVTYFTTFKAADEDLKRPYGKYSDYREMRYKDLLETAVGFSIFELELVDDWKLVKVNKGGK